MAISNSQGLVYESALVPKAPARQYEKRMQEP
jgi:hypothetical protein